MTDGSESQSFLKSPVFMSKFFKSGMLLAHAVMLGYWIKKWFLGEFVI